MQYADVKANKKERVREVRMGGGEACSFSYCCVINKEEILPFPFPISQPITTLKRVNIKENRYIQNSQKIDISPLFKVNLITIYAHL